MITKPDGRHPADLSDVRATNLALVLRFVAAHAPCSRADIAAATRMTKATASSLVGELIERQLLRETGQTVRRVGRPATMIELDGSPYAWIGVDLAPGLLTAVALDPAGRVLLSWRRAVPARADGTPGPTLAAAATLARRALEQLRHDGREVLGLTLGVPGPVDGDGVVPRSPELGWQDVAVRDTVAKALDDPALTVTVCDSTMLAARAEHRQGEHAGTADMVYLTGTSRVLAAVIADGAVLHGGRGRAGAIGHLPVDGGETDPGRTCGCGCGRTGCLDAVATITALARRLDPHDPLTDLDRSVDTAVVKARAADPATVAALADFGRRLGSGLAPIVDLLDPSVVVLGGHYARIAPWVLPAAEQELRARTTADGHRLVASALGHRAAATGGAAGALDILDADPLPPRFGWDRDHSKS